MHTHEFTRLSPHGTQNRPPIVLSTPSFTTTLVTTTSTTIITTTTSTTTSFQRNSINRTFNPR